MAFHKKNSVKTMITDIFYFTEFKIPVFFGNNNGFWTVIAIINNFITYAKGE